jgi:hypothetical protein
MMDIFSASDAARVLWWTIRQGFTRHVVGPIDDPHVVVLFYDWGAYVDLAHVRGIDRTEVARIPRRTSELNVYRPDTVVWHYWGGIADALNALMLLPSPFEGEGPTRPYEPPRNQMPLPENGNTRLAISPEELTEVTVLQSNYCLPDRN